jgi:hypothetical protein
MTFDEFKAEVRAWLPDVEWEFCLGKDDDEYAASCSDNYGVKWLAPGYHVWFDSLVAVWYEHAYISSATCPTLAEAVKSYNQQRLVAPELKEPLQYTECLKAEQAEKTTK